MREPLTILRAFLLTCCTLYFVGRACRAAPLFRALPFELQVETLLCFMYQMSLVRLLVTDF